MRMPIRVSPSALREGRWYEYLIRFGLGGVATVLTGLISSRYGPSIGGLFPALPAIFCASASRHPGDHTDLHFLCCLGPWHSRSAVAADPRVDPSRSSSVSLPHCSMTLL